MQRRLVSAGVLVLAVIHVATPLTRPVVASDGYPGRNVYFRYCASCHGDDGKGHGVVADSLKRQPADLTQIATRRGGVFPSAEVQEIIDGRKRVAAHGTSEMPVWGKIFAHEPASMTPAAHAESQIDMITHYLSSIQTH